MSKKSKKTRRQEQPETDHCEPVADGSAPKRKTTGPMLSQAAFRELVESVVIALVLAFLFRTFEAQAFVIPTGSMATTLMGRHKDVVCPMCGYGYQVSASEEVDQNTGALVRGKEVVGGTCPMCRFTDYKLDRDPSFNGDRILVGKFAYQFEQPQRWDVAVFHYPAEAKTNYIKRIVGLPGETIRIQQGDLYVKPDGAADHAIARKPPEKVQAMLRVVDDIDYVLPEKLLSRGWPARWQPTDPDGVWQRSEDYKSFSIDGESSGESEWLRYRHFVPDQYVWEAVGRGPLRSDYQPQPQLISDFCAYNTTMNRGASSYDVPGLGLHWVGDLAVSCSIDVRRPTGSVVLELVEGGRQMQCQLDLASGEAALSIVGEAMDRRGATRINRPGAHTVMFANIDDQLLLWVDGNVVAFDGDTTYGPLDNRQPQEADLSPVGIASLGADVRIADLKVLRDIYYIADRTTSHAPITDFVKPIGQSAHARAGGVAALLSKPDFYDVSQMQTAEFVLDEDQFLMLGDNSARSKDSRLWGPEFFVQRDLLIGKALFIYWPHSWDSVTIGNTKIPFPFFPNVARMRLVR